jgi:hypothetical protein
VYDTANKQLIYGGMRLANHLKKLNLAQWMINEAPLVLSFAEISQAAEENTQEFIQI